MDKIRIEQWAKTMIESYVLCASQGEAVERVKDKHPQADLNILWSMWITIDTYRFINQ